MVLIGSGEIRACYQLDESLLKATIDLPERYGKYITRHRKQVFELYGAI
jgi:hypothetical protein